MLLMNKQKKNYTKYERKFFLKEQKQTFSDKDDKNKNAVMLSKGTITRF